MALKLTKRIAKAIGGALAERDRIEMRAAAADTDAHRVNPPAAAHASEAAGRPVFSRGSSRHRRVVVIAATGGSALAWMEGVKWSCRSKRTATSCQFTGDCNRR